MHTINVQFVHFYRSKFFFIAAPLNCWRFVGFFTFFLKCKKLFSKMPSTVWIDVWICVATNYSADIAVAVVRIIIIKHLIYLCKWPWKSAKTCSKHFNIAIRVYRSTCVCLNLNRSRIFFSYQFGTVTVCLLLLKPTDRL